MRQESEKQGQETRVTLVVFDYPTNIKVPYVAKPISQVGPLGTDYWVGGSTALTDAVLKAISELQVISVALDEDVSYLVQVLTDGEENTSRNSSYTLLDKIKNLQYRDDWTFAFSVPKGHAKLITMRYGVEPGNVQEWDTTDVAYGLQNAVTSNVIGTSNFYAARSTGVKKSSNFYQTDLSGVTSADLTKLINVSDDFWAWKVERECPIQSFVEAKGKQYVPGNAYYQLMKRETIQAQKKILIKDKTTKQLYGGDAARQLLGLPQFELKVDPGNHMNYDIFVQSTSTNRRLVRGTTLLYLKK